MKVIRVGHETKVEKNREGIETFIDSSRIVFLHPLRIEEVVSYAPAQLPDDERQKIINENIINEFMRDYLYAETEKEIEDIKRISKQSGAEFYEVMQARNLALERHRILNGRLEVEDK